MGTGVTDLRWAAEWRWREIALDRCMRQMRRDEMHRNVDGSGETTPAETVTNR